MGCFKKIRSMTAVGAAVGTTLGWVRMAALLGAAVACPGWAQETPRTIEVAELSVSLELDAGAFEVETESRKLGDGLHLVTLRLHSPRAAEPPPLALKWSLPSHDVAGFWSVTAGMQKVVRASWYPSQVTSTAARSAPVFSLFGHDDGNRLTVAVSDALNAVELRAGLIEEDGLQEEELC